MDPMSDTDFADEAPTASRSVEYHWLRGALWGLSLGIGLALYAVIFRIVTLQVTTMALIVVLGVLLGLAWSRFGPTKG
jgi:Flp pilus assembly protein TadB